MGKAQCAAMCTQRSGGVQSGGALGCCNWRKHANDGLNIGGRCLYFANGKTKPGARGYHQASVCSVPTSPVQCSPTFVDAKFCTGSSETLAPMGTTKAQCAAMCTQRSGGVQSGGALGCCNWRKHANDGLNIGGDASTSPMARPSRGREATTKPAFAES